MGRAARDGADDLAGGGIFEWQRLLAVGQDPIAADEAAGGIEEEVEVGLLGHGVWPTPSPTLPTRGRVSAGSVGTIQPPSLTGTSPLVGEVGRGVAAVKRHPPVP